MEATGPGAWPLPAVGDGRLQKHSRGAQQLEHGTLHWPSSAEHPQCCMRARGQTGTVSAGARIRPAAPQTTAAVSTHSINSLDHLMSNLLLIRG